MISYMYIGVGTGGGGGGPGFVKISNKYSPPTHTLSIFFPRYCHM